MNTKRIVIEPGKTAVKLWEELWAYKELLGFLAWRDVKIRYKQAVLGAAWAIIQPLVQCVILTFIFWRVAGMSSGSVPYPAMVLAGLVPWQLFSSAFSGTGNSLVANGHIISKVYFPRLIIPLSIQVVALVDMAILLLTAAPVALYYGLTPTWHLLILPLFVALTLLIAFGAGLWISALSVKYRDFRFISPFILQLGLFVTPVGFRSDTLKEWGDLMALNPLTGALEGFRWSLLGGQCAISPHSLLVSVAGGLVLVGTGLWYFRATERQFSDYI